MRTRALPLTLLLLGIVALPPAAEAGTLKLRSVSAARSATAGLPVEVSVAVARHGRTRAAKVSFYLAKSAKHGRNDVHLKGDAKVGKGRSRVARVAAAPRIPGGQPLGAYRLIACLGKSCRAATGSLQVTAEPVGTRELVDAAVAAHRLTPQQGLVYRVFGAFGDPRLPAAYAGDDAEPDDNVMREAAELWPKLSSKQRNQLRPFFLPPPARGSWAARAAGAARSRPAAVPSACDSDQLANRNWRSLAMPNGHVRVWWLKGDEDRIGPRARSFVAEIENHMWPRLVAVFGREPMRDGGQHCFHGIDDKLDIYMLRLDRKIATTEPYPPNCAGTPAFIVFDAGNHVPDRWEVAHELMHAFQFGYRYHDSCGDHNNWDEAVANWAAAYLYPKDDGEHYFPWFLRDPEDSLVDASYEGWVFPYAMQQLHGTGTLRAIYEQSEKLDLLDAINAGLPGGFKTTWPEFALAAWNQDPVSPNFVEWDRFGQIPEANKKPIAKEQLDLGPAGQNKVEVPLPLKPLSRAYRQLKFGAGVTRVNAVTPYDPDLHVDAILKFRDGTTRTEDFSKRRGAWFCPMSPGQRLDEMLLVVTNTSPHDQLRADQPLKVVASNLGCSRYTGTASGTAHVHWESTNITETWSATNLVFKRDPLYTDEYHSHLLFNLVGGSVTWSLQGTQYDCALKAGPVTFSLPTDGSAGALHYESWNLGGPVRPYSAWSDEGPVVTGTAACKDGTHPRSFRPHDILATSDAFHPIDVPPDGILQGTWTSDEQSGAARDVTYHWRLVPDP